MADDVASFTNLLRTALGSRLAETATSFTEMVADDVIMEFPFLPAGLPARLVGRDAVSAHLDMLSKLIAFDRMSLSSVHYTTDSDLTFVEFEGFGRGIATGEPYEQRYLSQIRTRGGQIIHYLDYWNPLVLLRTLKGACIENAISLGNACAGDLDQRSANE